MSVFESTLVAIVKFLSRSNLFSSTSSKMGIDNRSASTHAHTKQSVPPFKAACSNGGPCTKTDIASHDAKCKVSALYHILTLILLSRYAPAYQCTIQDKSQIMMHELVPSKRCGLSSSKILSDSFTIAQKSCTRLRYMLRMFSIAGMRGVRCFQMRYRSHCLRLRTCVVCPLIELLLF